MTIELPIEVAMLIYSVFLLLLQLVFQVCAGFFEKGFMGIAGSRDDDVLVSGIGGRFERAYYNMLETFPIFAALVLTLFVSESWSTTTALGAQLYFWGRVLYLPVYVAGIPILRTLVWLASMAGIVMIAWHLLGLVT